MTIPWKPVLMDYIRGCNRMESDYSFEALKAIRPLLTDENYLNKQQLRLRRLRNRSRLLLRQPDRSETKLKIFGVEERPGQTTVTVEQHKMIYFPNQPTEERIERERITFSSDYGPWKIKRIESQQGETSGQALISSSFPELLQEEAFERKDRKGKQRKAAVPTKSVPYLHPMLRDNEAQGRQSVYNREKVREYADRWWKEPNPDYLTFEVDCTNFISQCLYAGGAPMNYTGRRDSGWWYEGRQGSRELWSYSWTVAHSLQHFLASSRTGLHAEEVSSPKQLTIGDVIAYDWDGDDKFQHSTVVTEIAPDGMPLVNAHTISSKHRYWDYHDSYAWNNNTRYRFFHIADIF